MSDAEIMEVLRNETSKANDQYAEIFSSHFDGVAFDQNGVNKHFTTLLLHLTSCLGRSIHFSR